MKRLLSALVFAFAALTVGAQCNLVSSLTVSTGWDPITNSVLPVGNFDPMWKLVQSPTPPPGWTINIGGSAYTIAQSGSWDAAGTNSRYINAFNTNTSVLDNWPLTTLPYIFEREFCICDPSGAGAAQAVTFDLDLHADNQAIVYLEAPGGGQTLLFGQPHTYTTDHFQNPTDQYNAVQNLTPGTYKLVVHLRNKLSVMGWVLDGTLSGNGILADSACNNTGSIAGYKYSDTDNSGTITGSDPVEQGWVISLYQGGSFVTSMTTDMNGHYFFNGLAPGTYTVTETPQAGWVAVLPASGSQTVVVNANGVTVANFLNRDTTVVPPNQCDFDLRYTYQINRCQVDFTSLVSNIPTGYQVVSATWTFGDGHSSNLLNPTHFYTSTGTFEVCLEVIIFDGNECCTERYCEEIQIDEICEGDCDIDANIQYKQLEDCTFDFSTIINYTGTAITAWWWDFGDGTTGNGSFINHQFPGPGTYNVCVTLFGVGERGDCCFQRVCIEVEVDCDPCKGGEKRMAVGEGSDLPVDPRVRLYPNPSDGNISLTFDLNDTRDVNVVIVDMKGSVMFTQNLGEVTDGEQVFNLETGLRPGAYIITVNAGDDRFVERLLVN